jgi:hypothetical protein
VVIRRVATIVILIIVGILLLIAWINFQRVESFDTEAGDIFWLRLFIAASPLWTATAIVFAILGFRYADEATHRTPPDMSQAIRHRGSAWAFLIVALMFLLISLSVWVW